MANEPSNAAHPPRIQDVGSPRFCAQSNWQVSPMTKKKGISCSWNLIQQDSAAALEDVMQELDVITNTFDNVRVSGKTKAHQTVTIPILSQAQPPRRIYLEISTVPGYPYVAPNVRLVAPSASSSDGKSLFSDTEVEELRNEVVESIQPCLSSGIPCMMQIASTVTSAIERGGGCTRQGAESCTLPPLEQVSGAKTAALSTAGKSPSLTPVPLKAKDALKLSYLTLHLLRKCCLMKDPESKEEANSNFEWIAAYLMDHFETLPASSRVALPWQGDDFNQLFANELQAATEKPSERKDLLNWLWENEEQSMRFQLGSESRYQNEFIQQRLLGSGGFAPVYVCRKKIDGRLYAIKKIVMTGRESDKIIREVQTLAAFNHKNIVRYYDAWVEDGCDRDLRRFIDDDNLDTESDERIVQSRSGTDSTEDEDCSASHASNEDDSEESTGDSENLWNHSSSTSESSASGSHFSANRNYQTLYIQMELCSARSLRHLIEEGDAGNGIFTSEGGEKVAASILRQLLSVTAHTHHESIVHRDLKPDNVLFEMVSNDGDHGEIGTIRVADFGLARVMSGVQRNASTLDLDSHNDVQPNGRNIPTGNCGSVLYCAPEQEKGLDYDFKVDEFSIGMIALEMWLAIAGKGFRDRFNIMEAVWRTGNLPPWFVQWNTEIATVIGALLEQDSSKRKSCEEVLSTANLPGDPADIVEALTTLDRYGERIASRVVQKIMKQSIQYRKPPTTIRDMARLLGSTACTDVVQAVGIIGMLHGSVSVYAFDHLIPANPELSDLGVECVVDSFGRCFSYSVFPHFAVASFLGMQEGPAIGPFHALYHKTRPYAVFASPMKTGSDFNEALLQPVLAALHLFSLMESKGKIEIVISHASWLKAIFPKGVGTRPPPPKLLSHRFPVDAAEKVGYAISNISDALAPEGLIASDDRDDLIRKFVTAILDAIRFFGKPLASRTFVVLDPALLPSETLVSRGCLDRDMLLECRTTDGAALAFGCSVDNFLSKCTVLNSEIHGFCVTLDINELADNCKHLRMPGKEGLLLDGVAVRRHDLYSQAQLPSVVEASVELWKGNIRACIRNDSDAHALTRSLKAKHIRWVLVDGKRLVAVSSLQQNKAASKQSDVPRDLLQSAVRELVLEAKSARTDGEAEVVFLSGPEDRRIAKEAQDVFANMVGLMRRILVVPATVSDIESCLKDGFKEGTPVQQNLQNWVAENLDSLGVLPIYAYKEGQTAFFTNRKRFQVKKKDLAKKKK